MTEPTLPAAHAAEATTRDVPVAAPTDPVIDAVSDAAGAHGMRPIALAFVAGNAAVLAVFAVAVATGHLDLGGNVGALGEALLTTATAAPTS